MAALAVELRDEIEAVAEYRQIETRHTARLVCSACGAHRVGWHPGHGCDVCGSGSFVTLTHAQEIGLA